MTAHEHYPRYLSYSGRKLQASVLEQEFPLPSFERNETYYPPNRALLPFFSSEQEVQKFGASQFCSFLNDTIEVEHSLVIPAIASLRRIPYNIPLQPRLDLFKTATDEGFHAEQSLRYLSELDLHFDLQWSSGKLPPLFIRRLEHQRDMESDRGKRQLMNILNGIVTETRISVELSKFATNRELAGSVKQICLTHAQDEVIHSSQFQALGCWLWEAFDEPTKEIASAMLVHSTIARSLPDIDNIILSYMKATGRSLEDACGQVMCAYDADLLIQEMLVAAKPTIGYLSKLGIEQYVSVDNMIEQERNKLRSVFETKK